MHGMEVNGGVAKCSWGKENIDLGSGVGGGLYGGGGGGGGGVSGAAGLQNVSSLQSAASQLGNAGIGMRCVAQSCKKVF